ncbi:hypothetical protein HK101_000251 [Irineochytrium annulatum]|nr:hypothetical protein HK101_000251 [Irineochytrium annulatum]
MAGIVLRLAAIPIGLAVALYAWITPRHKRERLVRDIGLAAFNSPVGYYVFHLFLRRRKRAGLPPHRRLCTAFEQGPLRIVPVPYASDNYGYLIIDRGTMRAVAVDPADAEALLQALASHPGVTLSAILCTHHHWDHSAGNVELARCFPGLAVYGSTTDFPEWSISSSWRGVNRRVRDGDQLTLGRFRVEVLQVACHTRGHVCFVVELDERPAKGSAEPGHDAHFVSRRHVLGGGMAKGARVHPEEGLQSLTGGLAVPHGGAESDPNSPVVVGDMLRSVVELELVESAAAVAHEAGAGRREDIDEGWSEDEREWGRRKVAMRSDSGSPGRPAPPSVFTGDTIFVGGAGMFFEGDGADYLKVIKRLGERLDGRGDVMVWPGHEYALNNLRFAYHLEPSNMQLQMQLQQTEDKAYLGIACVPSLWSVELETNPFIRIAGLRKGELWHNTLSSVFKAMPGRYAYDGPLENAILMARPPTGEKVGLDENVGTRADGEMLSALRWLKNGWKYK